MARDTSRKTWLAAALACLATGIVWTGCGSDSDEDTESSTAESSTASSGSLSVGTDPTYPPYEFKEGSEYAGLEIDLMRAIGEELGVDVTFSDVRYAAAYDAVNADRFDVVVIGGASDVPERRKEITMVDAFELTSGIMVPEGNPEGFTDAESLCGHSVAVFAATTTETEVKAVSEECDTPMEIDALSDANGPYLAVQTGRADAYVGDYMQGAYQAEQLGTEMFPAPDIESILGAFAVAKGNDELAQELAAGLQAVVDSGEAAEIAESYGIDPEILVDPVTINAGNIPVTADGE